MTELSAVDDPVRGLAEGRTVLITGGLGALGRPATRRLQRAGAKVVVADRAEEPPDDHGHDIGYVSADVTDPEAVVALVDRAWDFWGALTDVVLLAGRVHSAPILEQTPDDVDAVLRLNLLGSMLVAQEVSRRWRSEARPGQLVFVSSWVQDVPWPGVGPYAASKAALRSLARSFARELAPVGIRANVLAPGIVAAGMAEHQWTHEPDFRRRARRAVPLGRLQPPGSVADALVFLCSPMSTYMTGATLLVDGGASLYPLDPEEIELSD